MLIKEGDRRKEFEQTWEWRDPDMNMRGHWKSVVEHNKGNLVMIFPPSGDVTSWYVDVCDEERYELCGESVEERAFCIGVGFVQQYRGPLDKIL